MSSSYLIGGLMLCVAGLAMTTLRLSRVADTIGRLTLLLGLLIVAAWVALALFPDLGR